MSIDRQQPLRLEAEGWAEEHRYLLVACFARFQADGEWPTLEHLQHQFELDGRDEDVSRLSWTMPRALGAVEQQRLVLLIRGMNEVPAATPLLADWCAVLKLSYATWRRDPTAKLTRASVLGLLDGDSARTRSVYTLIMRESWPFGSGYGGPEDEWWREMISAVRAARDARVPQDILRTREPMDFPTPIAPEPVAPDEEHRFEQHETRVRGAWDLISGNTLIATVLGGMVVLVIGAYFVHSANTGSSSSRPAPGPSNTQKSSGLSPTRGGSQQHFWPERAGSRGARTFSRPAGPTEGPRVSPDQQVEVSCRAYDPEPESVLPDGYWYRIATSPWNSRYYAPANSFWNGDIPGQRPYTHNTDFAVRRC